MCRHLRRRYVVPHVSDLDVIRIIRGTTTRDLPYHMAVLLEEFVEDRITMSRPAHARMMYFVRRM